MRLSPADLQRLRGGDPTLLRQMRPVFHQAARAGCAHAKVQAEVFAEDVGQELWMLFMGAAGERFDPQYNLEPWLIEASRRIALSLQRKSGKESLLEDVFPSSHEDDERSVADTGSMDNLAMRDASLDRERALQYLRNKSNTIRKIDMHFVVTQPSPVTVASLPEIGQTPRKPTSAPQRSAQSAELRHIRETRRFSHQRMATELMVNVATYQSYEYGRVRNIPPEVMDRARALLEDADYSSAKEKFGGRSTQEIFEEWARRMGTNPAVSEMARMLGLDKSTISRWMSGQVNPTYYQLVLLEKTVEEQERRRKRAGLA